MGFEETDSEMETGMPEVNGKMLSRFNWSEGVGTAGRSREDLHVIREQQKLR